MPIGLTAEQGEAREAFRAFADAWIRPSAAAFDRDEALPPDLIRRLADRGYLAAMAPVEHGGLGMDAVTFGLLCEEIGSACSSVRSLLTVQAMVCHAVGQWGSEEQRARWLPMVARGEAISAFALTEPDVGSDARHVDTRANPDGDTWVLDGRKKWISFGETAHLVLVLARHEDGTVAFVVEADRPGFARHPLRGMLGTRASMLAEIAFEGCRVPASSMLGKPGFGFTVVGSALDVGRYSVAWGCVGIAQACLDACVRYSAERRQFGATLAEHQLVQRMLADMITDVRAARLLCLQAGRSRREGAPSAVLDTLVAKYFASTAAMRASRDAVQMHGANGCGPELPVARYFRDAKVMEIIEGSTEIQQMLIARHAKREARG